MSPSLSAKHLAHSPFSILDSSISAIASAKSASLAPLMLEGVLAATAPAPDALSWGAGPQCRAAWCNRAGPGTRYRGPFRRTRARRAGTHGLGAPAQARVRNRPRTLPAVWRRLEDHRRHRRSSSPSNAIFSSREIFNRGPVGAAVVETVRITRHECRRCG